MTGNASNAEPVLPLPRPSGPSNHLFASVSEFFLDVGLTNYRIGFKEFFNRTTSLDNVYRGKISEPVVAPEIISQTDIYPSLHFWIREKGAAETDFIFIRCPIIYYPTRASRNQTG
jgi:predicted AAA+ superfamily ATPase